MSEKVSMNSIAKKLGVSKNTVSLALRGIPGISENTRKLILDTAASLGYKYKGFGRQYGITKNLCLVMPKSARDSMDFFSLIQMGIEDEAKKNNMNTILHYYDESEEEFRIPLCIKDGIVSGVIALGRVCEKIVKILESYKHPIVLVDNYFDGLLTDCVLTDNHSGGYIATEYLLENGHTDIGFFGPIDVSVSYYDRYMGCMKALKAWNVRPDNAHSIFVGYESPTEAALNALKRLMTGIGLPTAFVCCNDASAIHLYKVLKQLGILIPDQISVIGFDDISSSSDVSPELTTMRVNKDLMGRKAVMKLLSRLGEHDGIAEKLLLSATLVERNSVRRRAEA